MPPNLRVFDSSTWKERADSLMPVAVRIVPNQMSKADYEREIAQLQA